IKRAQPVERAGVARARVSMKAVPPPVLVLLSMTSVQVGAALAKSLFHSIGPTGAVFLRVGFAALILLVVWRPKLRGYTWREYRWALLFGGVLAAMNFSFYQSLDRIPLGVSVTVEFVGPLAVALIGSRRLIDLLWVALAGAGIVLLAPTGLFGGITLDPLGIGLALLAGVFWGCYILLSARVGQSFSGVSGLALAMAVAAILLVPVGVFGAGSVLLNGRFLLLGAGVALLSSVLPYSLELEALRRLPSRVFSVLMSLEPGIAALVGVLLLGEQLGMRAAIAIALVIAASLGAAQLRKKEPQEG
ncbi:MAG TPA: DMT family transporter, partial [Ktedonobacterales bacterium]|nr:DMT family transporter [Ktedonobacterales bacterium]